MSKYSQTLIINQADKHRQLQSILGDYVHMKLKSLF